MQQKVVAIVAFLMLSATFAAASGKTCSIACSSACAKCTRLVDNPDGSTTVDINLDDCKGSSISWLCCRNAGCNQDSCQGSPDLAYNKCQGTTLATYTVPAGFHHIDIQIHDGQITGTANCSLGNGMGAGECCGGSKGGCGADGNGVCDQRINFASCASSPTPPSPPPAVAPECTSDAQCTDKNTVCATGVCNAQGACEQQFKSTETVCRASTDLCDAAEYCTGSSASCPADAMKPSTHVCRAAAGACDVADTCTGTSAACPADVFKPAGTLCRANADLCDVQEVCTGTAATCPADLRKDNGYTYKCGTTCFLCAINANELVQGKGKAVSAGGCTIGACKNTEALPWPACANQCVPKTCPNEKDLSNAAFQQCQKSDGSWSCTEKKEGDDVTNGVCPLPWPTAPPQAPSTTAAVPNPPSSSTDAPAPVAPAPVSGKCSWTCSKQCAKCVARKGNRVQIDTTGCKGSAISWLCCRDAGCARTSCSAIDNTNGGVDGDTKCEDVTKAWFQVAAGATSLNVQYHDGQLAGDVACTKATCCGGSGTSCKFATSGVCNQPVDLSECPDSEDPTTPPVPAPTTASPANPPVAECTADSDCAGRTVGACDQAACVAGQCQLSFKPAGTACRDAAGDCDVAATCSGDSAVCPANAFKAATTVCRAKVTAADGSSCDVEEKCTGSSASCPADQFEDIGTGCRVAAGDCDVAATCSGDSAVCPANAFKAATTVCRAKVTAADGSSCDVEEKCTGSSASCPADQFEDIGTGCRAAAGDCDVAATCSGTAVCPANAFKAATTVCRAKVTAADGSSCDVEEKCTGSSASCPADQFIAEGTSCRTSAGVCDVTETCTGRSNACPANGFKPATHVCRAQVVAEDGTSCDEEEKCTGSTASCPEDFLKPAGAVCRDNRDRCDKPERCTGSSKTCGSDIRNDHSYSYKCATTCYTCGAANLRPDGNKHVIGAEGHTCTAGSCDNEVVLDYPECLNQCIPKTCANNRDLSNGKFTQCDLDDGLQKCKLELEGANVADGICPLPYTAGDSYGVEFRVSSATRRRQAESATNAQLTAAAKADLALVLGVPEEHVIVSSVALQQRDGVTVISVVFTISKVSLSSADVDAALRNSSRNGGGSYAKLSQTAGGEVTVSTITVIPPSANSNNFAQQAGCGTVCIAVLAVALFAIIFSTVAITIMCMKRKQKSRSALSAHEPYAAPHAMNMKALEEAKSPISGRPSAGGLRRRSSASNPSPSISRNASRRPSLSSYADQVDPDEVVVTED